MKKVMLSSSKEKILEGINLTADVVKSTMGGKGQLILINDGINSIKFTKDGVSVAKEISFEDPEMNMGADLVKTAATKTVKLVGDGTTCTTVLLQAFANQLLNSNYEDIRKELSIIESDLEDIYEQLYLTSIKVENVDDIKNISTISSDSEVLGELMKEVYSKTGMDSLVSLELGDSETTHFEVKTGIEFKEGYVHQSFANMPNQQCVLESPLVYLTKEPCINIEKFRKLIEGCLNADKPLLIISPRYTTQFIRDCVANVSKAGLKLCLVKLPGYGRYLDENYKDILCYLNDKKEVEKAVIGANYMRLFNENTPNKQSRVEELRVSVENALDIIEKRDFFKRIHRLNNSSAVIYAGGITEQAAKEEFDRIEDAIGAVRAALKKGYVPGGGLALYNISKKDYHPALKKVLQAPIRQIISNSGESPDIILYNINDIKGYNVRNYSYENFVEAGIIDPVEVLVESLKNSFSTIKLLARTSYNININYEKKLF